MKQKSFSISDIFFRIFPGLAGGFLGTGIFLIAFLLLQFPASGNTENTAFSSFSVLVITFLGGVSTNVLAVFFLSLANPEKFPERARILTNVFLLSIITFLAIVPFVLLSKVALSIAGIYFIFSAMISTMLMANPKDNSYIIEVAGAVFSGFFLLLVFMKIFEGDSGGAMLAILLFILPVSWFFISLFALIGEIAGSFLRREE